GGDRLVEHPGAGDLLLQLLDVPAVADLELAAVQGVGDVDQQLAHPERFDHVAVGAGFERHLHQPGVVDGGDHDGGGVDAFGRNVLEQVEPGLPGHPDVDQ